ARPPGRAHGRRRSRAVGGQRASVSDRPAREDAAPPARPRVHGRRRAAVARGEPRVPDPAPGPSPPAPMPAGRRAASRRMDGRLDTAWTTGRPQIAGDRLRVTFGAPVELTAVALQSGPAFAEFPRNPMLDLQDETGEWAQAALVERPLERWRTMEALMTRPI